MRLKKLRLRGAIGLKPYGEEVTIDFERFDSGPIALVAVNGAGKTTILENLHPWPKLVSRDGSLTHHFHLKDSLRELEFEYAGHVYLCKILIDGPGKRIEAYLYQDGEPLNDGKTPSYKENVNSLFGSPEIFFKSIFQSQNGTRIAEMTDAPKKQLFVGLLGLDRYERLVKAAKAEIESIQPKHDRISGQIEILISTIDTNIEKLKGREDLVPNIAKLEAEIQTSNSELQQRRGELKEAEQKVAGRRQILDKITSLEKERNQIVDDGKAIWDKQTESQKQHKKELSVLEAELETLARNLANADSIRQNVSRLEELTSEESELNNALSALKQLNLQKTSLVIKMDAERNELEGRNKILLQSLKDAEGAAERLETVPCKDTEDFVMTCPLIVSARQAKSSINTIKEDLRHIFEKLRDGPVSLLEEIADIVTQINNLSFDEDHYQKVSTEFGELKKTDWHQLLSNLDRAEVKIEERKRQIESIKNQHQKADAEFEERLSEVKPKVDLKSNEISELLKSSPEIPDIDPISGEINRLETKLSETQISLGQAKGQLDVLNQLHQENEKHVAQKSELTAEKQTMASDISEWRLLESAFGKNGLQALELDAAGPQISSIATEILQEFGREWSISIRTVRASADKKKDVETFDIIVSTPAGIRNFDDLSGGEKVWVEESIRKAITIYLIKHSGRDYRTLMQDEADGALDPDRARAFLDTAFKAHELTGAHHTIVISQRPEIWRQIDQRIHLYPEEGKIDTVLG